MNTSADVIKAQADYIAVGAGTALVDAYEKAGSEKYVGGKGLDVIGVNAESAVDRDMKGGETVHASSIFGF